MYSYNPERNSLPRSSQEQFTSDIRQTCQEVQQKVNEALRTGDDHALEMLCWSASPERITRNREPLALHSEDIIAPLPIKSTDKFAMTALGLESSLGTTYKNSYSRGYENKHMIREWHRSHIEYILQRKQAFAATMDSLRQGAPLTELETKWNALLPICFPSVRGYGRDELPQSFYETNEWIQTGVCNALLLPPDKSTAAMKRQACQYLGELAQRPDLDSTSSNFRVYNRQLEQFAAQQGALRLPEGMVMTAAEYNATLHREWSSGPMYKEYFGTRTEPKANSLARLLHERPQDYVQILLLRLIESGDTSELAATSGLSEEIQDVIFAPDASFNTVFDWPNNRQEQAEQQLGLRELLEINGAHNPETSEQLLAQREAVTGHYRAEAHRLREELRQLREATARAEQEKQRNAPYEQLCTKYGVAPYADDDTFEAVIAAQRRRLAQLYHPNNGSEPNEERMKQINAELDALLRARGLKRG